MLFATANRVRVLWLHTIEMLFGLIVPNRVWDFPLTGPMKQIDRLFDPRR